MPRSDHPAGQSPFVVVQHAASGAWGSGQSITEALAGFAEAARAEAGKDTKTAMQFRRILNELADQADAGAKDAAVLMRGIRNIALHRDTAPHTQRALLHLLEYDSAEFKVI